MTCNSSWGLIWEEHSWGVPHWLFSKLVGVGYRPAFVSCPELTVLILLQVKNIIYHAVKDAVGTLKAHESKLARS